MKAIILDNKFYIVSYDDYYGWYGTEISAEAYDALKECKLDKEKNLNKFTNVLEEN